MMMFPYRHSGSKKLIDREGGKDTGFHDGASSRFIPVGK
jgi:hypothetical protein